MQMAVLLCVTPSDALIWMQSVPTKYYYLYIHFIIYTLQLTQLYKKAKVKATCFGLKDHRQAKLSEANHSPPAFIQTVSMQIAVLLFVTPSDAFIWRQPVPTKYYYLYIFTLLYIYCSQHNYIIKHRLKRHVSA